MVKGKFKIVVETDNVSLPPNTVDPAGMISQIIRNAIENFGHVCALQENRELCQSLAKKFKPEAITFQPCVPRKFFIVARALTPTRYFLAANRKTIIDKEFCGNPHLNYDIREVNEVDIPPGNAVHSI